MSVRVILPPSFHDAAKGVCEIICSGRTAGDILNSAVKKYPWMKDRIFDDDGKIKRSITLYLNEEEIGENWQSKRVKSGDEIAIIQAMAGG